MSADDAWLIGVADKVITVLRAENQQLHAEVATLTRCGSDMADGLGRLTRERDALVRQIDSARFALAHCTCICKWVAEARAAVLAACEEQP